MSDMTKILPSPVCVYVCASCESMCVSLFTYVCEDASVRSLIHIGFSSRERSKVSCIL